MPQIVALIHLLMYGKNLNTNFIHNDRSGERVSEEKVGRRDYTKTVAGVVAGLVVGGVAGYLSKPEAERITETITKTVTATPEVGPPEYTFYSVSHASLVSPYWVTVKKGVDLAASIVNTKVVFLAPEEFSIKAEVDMLESAIEAKPDALIVAITAHEPMDEPLRRAIRLGIPVVAFDTADPRPYPERIPYLGYVGMADYLCGKWMALRSLKEFKPTRAVIAEHEPGATYSVVRVQGITDAFKEMGVADVPLDRLDVTMDPAKMSEILKSYLLAHPDCNLAFSLGDVCIHPFLMTLREMGLAGKTFMSTVNVNDEAIEAIKKGEMICAIGEQPFAVGFIPIVWMYLHLKIGYLPPDILPTGPAIVDKETLNIALKQIEKAGSM